MTELQGADLLVMLETLLGLVVVLIFAVSVKGGMTL